MHSILSARGARVLSQFARANALLAFDYDGTLAPIAASPGTAGMRRATRTLLRRIAERYPTVVISGRAYDDIAARLGGIRVRQVFGNHGIEPFSVSAVRSRAVRRWALRLQARLGGVPGIVIENKTHSLAVHYRHARDRAGARRAVDAAIQGLKGARAIEGAAAVNLLPRRGANKGMALRQACRLAGCERAIYVGDDGTDEDAFTALPSSRLVGIRVGRSRESGATYGLGSQRDIDTLLRVLLSAQPDVVRSGRQGPRR